MAESERVEPRGGHASERVVLVAEDNEVNFELVSAALELDGFKILWAHDGSEAVAAAATDYLDLLILDLHLPSLSGLDVLRRVRANPATHELPVLVLTADAMTGTRDAVLAEGATDFMTKPYNLAALRSAIARIVR